MTSCGVSERQKPRYKRELEKIVGRELEFRGPDPVAHSRREKNEIIRARNELAARMQNPRDVPAFHDLAGGYSDA